MATKLNLDGRPPKKRPPTPQPAGQKKKGRPPGTPCPDRGKKRPNYPKVRAVKRTCGDWKPAFLTSLRAAGNVRLACEAAGIARSTAHDMRNADAAFRAAWDEALEDAMDLLEGEAWRRALESSDRMLEFMLKGGRPQKYRERYTADVNMGGSLEVKEEATLARRRDYLCAALARLEEVSGAVDTGDAPDTGGGPGPARAPEGPAPGPAG